MSTEISNLLNATTIRKSLVEYLAKAETSEEFNNNLNQILEKIDKNNISWTPVGEQYNNNMIADITDNMTGLVENITNSADAYLLQNYMGGNYNSSHQAADELLSNEKSTMRFDGSKKDSMSIMFSDSAHGQSKENFDVFVSPYSSGRTKQKYDFIQGMRGVGGMTALAHTDNGEKFIASASNEDPESWTWTVIKQMENDDYYYLTINGEFPTFKGKFDCGEGFGQKEQGTVIKLYNYNLRTNPKDVTNNAFRRRFSRYLPNPVVPVNIIDNRSGCFEKYEYTGIKDEINNKSQAFYDEISGSVDIPTVGSIEISVYIKKRYKELKQMSESGEISDEYVGTSTNIMTTNNESRVLVTVNGQSHQRYSKADMKRESNIKNAGDNMLVLVEFNDNTEIANKDIFNTGRNGFSDTGMEKTIMNSVYKFISENKRIDNINNKFTQQIKNEEDTIIQKFNLKGRKKITVNEDDTGTFKLNVGSNHNKWWSQDNISYGLSVLAGCVNDYSVNIDNNDSISVNIDPEFEENDKIICEVFIEDDKNKKEKTLILKKEKESESINSAQDVIKKYDTDDKCTISSLLDKMSGHEKELVAGMSKSEIQEICDNVRFEIDNQKTVTKTQNDDTEKPSVDSKVLDNSIKNISNMLNIDLEEEITFEKGEPKVYEVVNALLEPYGFEECSENGFKREAGGHSYSANKIKNYGDSSKHGYTYLEDIIDYCRNEVENSVWISQNKVQEELNRIQSWVDNGNIMVGERSKSQTILRTLTGFLAEEGMKKDAEQYNNTDIKLDREEYNSSQITDGGIDVHKVNNEEPDINIQIKKVQLYLLVDIDEFFGKDASHYIGYEVHVKNEHELMSGGTGVRVSRGGWAKEEDFSLLPKDVNSEKYSSISFGRNHNMAVPTTDLRPMTELFDKMSD